MDIWTRLLTTNPGFAYLKHSLEDTPQPEGVTPSGDLMDLFPPERVATGAIKGLPLLLGAIKKPPTVFAPIAERSQIWKKLADAYEKMNAMNSEADLVAEILEKNRSGTAPLDEWSHYDYLDKLHYLNKARAYEKEQLAKFGGIPYDPEEVASKMVELGLNNKKLTNPEAQYLSHELKMDRIRQYRLSGEKPSPEEVALKMKQYGLKEPLTPEQTDFLKDLLEQDAIKKRRK
jgi:hypothetical protein